MLKWNENISVLLLGVSASVVVATLSNGQVLPCVEEYMGGSCTLFADPDNPCPPIIKQEGTCPQTKRAQTGLTTQDPSYPGPVCDIMQLQPDPDDPDKCIWQANYYGPGRCRTASGTACPGSPGGS